MFSGTIALTLEEKKMPQSMAASSPGGVRRRARCGEAQAFSSFAFFLQSTHTENL